MLASIEITDDSKLSSVKQNFFPVFLDLQCGKQYFPLVFAWRGEEDVGCTLSGAKNVKKTKNIFFISEIFLAHFAQMCIASCFHPPFAHFAFLPTLSCSPPDNKDVG